MLPAIDNLDRLRDALEKSDEELWRFHRSPVPIELINAIVASGMKVITFANLKGGVGKTTMAANIAAYLERLGHRVLLIDFDYQGSLSATVLRSAGRDVGGSVSDKVLAEKIIPAEVCDNQRKLGPKLPGITLLSAGYELNREETRTLFRWLLKLDEKDPRFALARLLAQPQMREFKYVIIDTPPRLTLATVNALAASTHLVVPTVLDDMSVENVGDFLTRTHDWFVRDLNPHLRFAGIIGTMTKQQSLNETELRSRKSVEDKALQHWDKLDPTQLAARNLDPWPADAHVMLRNVPDTARFMEDAGRAVAYLDTRAPNKQTRDVIDAIGADLLARVHK